MHNEAVRLAAPGDAPAITAIYEPYVVGTAISFETEPPSADEMTARMRKIGATFPWLVYEEGEVLGYAYASPHRDRAAYCWSADTAIYVKHGSHRLGIGRALYGVLIQILRLQGFHSAFGGITLPNPASVGLHERCGFLSVGVYKEVGFKLNAWHDVGWYGLQLSDASLPPQKPKLFVSQMFDQVRMAG